MRCKTCRYPLEGLTGPPHRCPECGGEFDPNDPSTFDDQAFHMPAWLRSLLLILLFLSILCAAIGGYLYWSFSSAFRNFNP